MWRHIAHSLAGAAHVVDGTMCQDASSVRVFGSNRKATLVACVADGAGSARYAHLGSTIACETIVENAATYFSTNDRFDGLDEPTVLRWCDEARARLQAEADQRDAPIRDFATTLCVAVAGEDFSAFFQIGDGAVVIGSRGTYGVVFWPQSGEYANSTNFITADDYQNSLEFYASDRRWSDLALFTDGLERLALRFDSRTPHAPFFDPIFRALRASTDLDVLNASLQQFLASESVQQRSDDDKTLILAARDADGLDDGA